MSKASAMAKFATSTPAPAEPAATVQPPPPAASPAAPVSDATPPVAEVKPEEGSRVALLAKKEAVLLREREAFKKQQEEFARLKAEAEEVIRRGKEFDELSKTDKIAALRKIGWSETDIINAVAGPEEKAPTPEEIARKAAQEETQRFKDELAKEKAEAEKAEQTRLVAKYKSDIGAKLKADPEKYEFSLAKGAEAEAQAYEIILEDIKQSTDPDPRPMPIEEALSIVEEIYEQEFQFMSQLKKAQPKVVEPPPAPEKASRTRTNVGKPPVSNVPQPVQKTYAAPPAPTTPKRETSEQKKARLIAALKNGGL